MPEQSCLSTRVAVACVFATMLAHQYDNLNRQGQNTVSTGTVLEAQTFQTRDCLHAHGKSKPGKLQHSPCPSAQLSTYKQRPGLCTLRTGQCCRCSVTQWTRTAAFMASCMSDTVTPSKSRTPQYHKTQQAHIAAPHFLQTQVLNLLYSVSSPSKYPFLLATSCQRLLLRLIPLDYHHRTRHTQHGVVTD